ILSSVTVYNPIPFPHNIHARTHHVSQSCVESSWCISKARPANDLVHCFKAKNGSKMLLFQMSAAAGQGTKA
ncbi:hypothetical protein PanWU01x14_039840, partial [Parasponia andersonii]